MACSSRFVDCNISFGLKGDLLIVQRRLGRKGNWMGQERPGYRAFQEGGYGFLLRRSRGMSRGIRKGRGRCVEEIAFVESLRWDRNLA